MKKLLLIALLLSAGGAKGFDRQSDSSALVAVYNSAGGAGWTNSTNWKTASAIDTWFGVTVESGRVTGLVLESNNLVGGISDQVGNLTNLQTLRLGNNHLSGILPSTMGKLTGLIYLGLNSNSLMGPIPVSIGTFSNLTCLNLSFNQFSGTIPTLFGNLVNLSHLYLNDNQLTGTIPVSLGSLVNLAWLWLKNNQLAGTIPAAFGNLVNLTSLQLQNNRLRGIVPSELGSLNGMTELFLNNNLLCNFGAGITSLTTLTSADFSSNRFCSAVSDNVVLWLNQYGPGWTTGQDCSSHNNGLSFVRFDQGSGTNNDVMNFETNGVISTLNPTIQEMSVNAISARGLAMTKNANNELWTANDQVNITRRLVPSTTDPGLVFVNDNTGTTFELTDDGDLTSASAGESEAGLVKADIYLENHVIEYNLADATNKEYCNFGDGRIEYPEINGQVCENARFYIKDHLGSTRMVVNVAGSPTEAIGYDAYGAIIRDDIIAGNEDYAKEKFTGKEMDRNGPTFCRVVYNIIVNNHYTGAEADNNDQNNQFIVEYADGMSDTLDLTNGTTPTSPTLRWNVAFQFPAAKTISYLTIKTHQGVDNNAVYMINLPVAIQPGFETSVSLEQDESFLVLSFPMQNYFTTATSLLPNVAFNGIGLDYFGARYYDPEVGVWTSTDPKGQLHNPYGYSSNPINTIDPNGEWLGALIGATIGAYAGGAMANGSLDPSKWDYNSVGTWTGIIGGAFNGGQLGNSIEMSVISETGNLTDSYSGKGKVETSEKGMKVVRENPEPANDLEKLAGQKLSEHVNEMQSPWHKFLGHNNLEYEIGASNSGKYDIIPGTKSGVTTPRSWLGKYDILMHSHPVGSGFSTPSIKGEFGQPGDYAALRNKRALGFKGEGALYVPDKNIFYRYNSVFSNGTVTNSYWELTNVLQP